MAARSRSGSTRSVLDDGDGLSERMDPYSCRACLIEGDLCVFHAGFAAGWDTCMEHVSAWALGDD
jgi:hypothetical protein